MGSSHTSQANPTLETALSGIKQPFRKKIIGTYQELKRRFARAFYDSAWDSSGLSVGKFCEAVLRFLQDHLTSTSISFGTHIPNFPDECRKLVTLPATAGLESLRVIIPRALVFLYTMRGKRGIGHVGGDVDANAIDAATVVRLCDWVFCELIRAFHGLSLEEAQGIVDAVSQRIIPAIWEIGGRKRILRKGLDYREKVLLLLYSDTDNGVLPEDLFDWCEYSSMTAFRRTVLKPLHKDRLIEWDQQSDIAYISPSGIQRVEEEIMTPSDARG
jgi:hypothetical protein